MQNEFNLFIFLQERSYETSNYALTRTSCHEVAVGISIFLYIYKMFDQIYLGFLVYVAFRMHKCVSFLKHLKFNLTFLCRNVKKI